MNVDVVDATPLEGDEKLPKMVGPQLLNVQEQSLFFALPRRSGLQAAVARDTKIANGHVGVQLALSKCGDSMHCHWCLFDNITAGTADTSVDSNAQETSLEQDARNEVFPPVVPSTE